MTTIYRRLLSLLIFSSSLVIGSLALGNTFNGFDLSNSLIPKKHIVGGGPPRDGIPAIYEPHYVSAESADFLKPDDIVLGLELGGERFAFPRYILNWHELVNGRVGDKVFLISYCPLCGSGMAFSSNVDGEQLRFGVSGLLYNSDLIFYDKNSESLWSQLEGRAISGKYAGTSLQQLNLSTTTWADWQARYSHIDKSKTSATKRSGASIKVLSENQGVKRNYRHDPYSGYDTSSQLFFKTLRKAPRDFHSKETVLGIKLGGKAKAYPFSELKRHGQAFFADSVGGREVRIVWDAKVNSAHIEDRQGNPLVSTQAYWFAWYNFHPQTEVFRSGK